MNEPSMQTSRTDQTGINELVGLQREVARLTAELDERDQTLRAIRFGEVDALLIGSVPGQEQVFTLSSADRPYRHFVESMSDGAATVSSEGIVLYANTALAALMHSTCDQIVGSSLDRVFTADSLLNLDTPSTGPIEADLVTRSGTQVPVRVSSSAPFQVNGQRITCITVIDLTGERQAEAKLEHQAQHDTLTGLPNRAVLTRRIQTAIAEHHRDRRLVALLFCDVDGFKNVNDAYGHAIGDQTLQVLARRLQDSVRPGDTVARIGGDEFVVLCRGLSTPEDAAMIAARIRSTVAQPILLSTTQLEITMSIGIALAAGDAPSASIDTLLRDADEAMYKAKRQGPNVIEVFDEPLRGVAAARLRTLIDLRKAQSNQELRLFYQPMMNLTDETPTGVEALIRWQHPDRGLVPPDQFIPLAEDTGLIIDIGSWVLAEACRQAAAWRDLSPGGQAVEMSVNVSSRQLAQGTGLLQDVRAALQESGIDPHTLVLEVTESALMDDAPSAMRVVNELKTLGVRIAIDDFGTGYSSLLYLKNFPVDLLKIDRSFIAGLGKSKPDSAIVRSVVDLAHALGIKAVAEGIETVEHLRILQTLGCTYGQGYLWSPALPSQGAGNRLRSLTRQLK